jgi:hypothetical protein
MGTLLHLPTPPSPTPNHTDEVWRGCWACGLVLFDDEPDLCTDCNIALNRPPTPPASQQRPLTWYLRHITPDTLRAMCDTITETAVTHAEEGAAAWAAEHLDGRQRATYIGSVRGRAQTEYAMRCHADAQAHGQAMGWAR